MTDETDPIDENFVTMYDARCDHMNGTCSALVAANEAISRLVPAPRPLAISAEEQAVETFLRSMVAAGYEVRFGGEPIDVEDCMARFAARSIMQVALNKPGLTDGRRRYATLNAGRLF